MRERSFLFALVALAGCSSTGASTPQSDAGAEGAASGDGATLPAPLNQTCAPVSLPDAGATRACDECTRSRCCDTRTTLFSFVDAPALIACAGDATCKHACEADCFKKYPAPTPALLEHVVCTTYFCQTECGDPPTACESCTNTKCLTESIACDRSPDCWLYLSCGNDCAKGDKTCLDACGATYPQGATTALPFITCSQTRCAGACQ